MDRLKVSANERVDIRDFRAGAGGDLVLAELLRLVRGIVLPGTRLSASQSGARIFSGFTIPAAAIGTATAMLQRGVGLFPLYDGGVTRFGVLAGEESPASIALDFSATGIGTHWVWVRIVQPDASQENRVFWNSNTADEFVNNVATRKVQTWEALFQLSSASPPGHGEWAPVAQIGVAVPNVIGSIVDLRDLFFEGDPSASYAQEWGDGVNDRDIDRAAYGVTDLHRFCALVRRQLTDILNPAAGAHYTVPAIDLNALSVEHETVGTHKTINTPRILVTAGPVSSTLLSMNPDGMDLDAPAMELFGQGNDLETVRGLHVFDRQGVLGRTNILSESFLMANGDPESVGVPGQRWGHYFTPGAAGTGLIYLPETGAPLHDDLHGRRIRLSTNIGTAADVFQGIRTGGYSNGQGWAGFWRIRNRPWIQAAIVLPSVSAGNEHAVVGLANDIAPLDSDVSRAYVMFTKPSNGAFLSIETPTGNFTSIVDLLGGAGLLANTLYIVKLAIMTANKVHAVVIRAPGVFVADTLSSGISPLTDGDLGGYHVNYSGIVLSRCIAGMTQQSVVDCYRMDVGDLAYIGPTLV